jgi:hypothetical protein
MNSKELLAKAGIITIYIDFEVIDIMVGHMALSRDLVNAHWFLGNRLKMRQMVVVKLGMEPINCKDVDWQTFSNSDDFRVRSNFSLSSKSCSLSSFIDISAFHI